MDAGEFNVAMDQIQIPIHGKIEIILVGLCYRNWDMALDWGGEGGGNEASMS